ncbi:zinc ribbon-containing protein, partial [Enterobacter roggenkampii]
YDLGLVVGLGILVWDNCVLLIEVYTPVVLSMCPKCGHEQFKRRPFET